jgi:gas vesicle protein
MSDEMNGSGGNMTGFLMGALVGAITGAGVSLLLAPRKGKDTREWLNTKYHEIRDRSAKALQQEKNALRKDVKEFVGEHESPAYIGAGAAKARL